MQVADWNSSDTARAQQIWAEYASMHNLSDRHGQAAGIDPKSGRIWFGAAALDIVEQMKREGESVPLFFVRVGYPSYLRKRGRR